MDKRYYEIVRCINESKPFCSLSTIARRLEVNEKTVLKIMEENEYLEVDNGFKLIRFANAYRLKVLDPMKFQEFFQEQGEKKEKEDLCYIMIRLIQAKEPVTIDALARELNYARISIDRMVPSIKEFAARYSLNVVSKRNVGYSVEGKEKDKRNCVKDCYRSYLSKGEDNTFVEVQRILNKVISNYELRLNNNGMYALAFHCYTAIKRIENGNTFNDHRYVFDQDCTKEKEAAAEIIDRFETSFGIAIPDNEEDLIVMHLLGKKMLEDQENISDTVWDCIARIIDEINRIYKIDLSHNDELKAMLAMHMEPLFARLRYGLSQKNEMINEIRKDLRFPFELAMCAKKVVKEVSGFELSDDELGFIAMHLALAIEKNEKGKHIDKKIIILCSSGMGAARLLQHKLCSAYHFSQENLELHSVFEIEGKDLSDYLCILSTIRLPFKPNIPVILADPTLNDEENFGLTDLLKDRNKNAKVFDLLKEENVFLNKSFMNKEGVMNFFKENVHTDEADLERAYSSSLYRESMGPTEIGNQTAIIHPYEYDEGSVILSMMTLKEGVLWNKEKARLIFFAAVPRNDRQLVSSINEDLALICTNLQLVYEILDSYSYKEVIVHYQEDAG